MENKVDDFDIVIIGASISGNYLATLLLNKGFKIAIIEEHNEIGLPLQCAGIVSKKLKKLVNFPDEVILNRVKFAKLVSPSGKSINLSGDEKPFIIDRISFDQYFYNSIKNSKQVQIFLNEKFKKFQYIGEREKLILVETNKRKLRSKILVGCDGPLSSVGRLLNQRNQILYASQIRVKGKFPNNEAIMYFHPDWRELFGWIVPEGYGNYRVGLAASNGIPSKFRKFKYILNIKDSQIIDRQGGIIPYGLMNKIAFNNILLLGDAAGQVKATTGGGIIMLLTAAKYAAICIIKALKSQDYSQDFLIRFYELPCKNTIGKELKIHYLIRIFLENLKAKEYDNLFRIMKSNEIEKIISIYGDMDFPRRLIIKLLGNYYFLKFLLNFAIRNPLVILKLFKVLYG
ncbi:MAG: NAD(P)/FAD-dependent oxidoreductase [Candidatus Lokiarchaeota archaeon]